MAVQNKSVNRKYNILNIQRVDDKKEADVYQRVATIIGAVLFFLTGGLVLLMVGIKSFDPVMLLISLALLGALVYIILSAFGDDSVE